MNKKCKSAVLELTNRCNMRCPHLASASGQERDQELSGNEWCHVVDTLAQIGKPDITLIGGEVFLSPNWLRIAERIKEQGMRLFIVSNGQSYTEQIRTQLRDLEPDSLATSLDGPEPASYQQVRGRDGFDSAWQGIQMLRDDGHRHVSAITTVMRSNLNHLPAFLPLLDGQGITWQIQSVRSVGSRFDNAELLTGSDYAQLGDFLGTVLRSREINIPLLLMDCIGYHALGLEWVTHNRRWRGCSAGSSTIGIRANGDVLGCLSLGDDFVEANLRKVPLEQIWTNERSFARLRNKELSGHCARCPEAETCRAGCPGTALTSSGELGCNEYCLRHQEMTGLLESAFTL